MIKKKVNYPFHPNVEDRLIGHFGYIETCLYEIVYGPLKITFSIITEVRLYLLMMTTTGKSYTTSIRFLLCFPTFT